MNMVLVSIVTMVGLGLVFAAVLSIAHQRLKVEEDPRVGQAEEALPGTNCGACGFGSCSAFAREVVEKKASIDGCVAGGTEVANKIAEILGVEPVESQTERKVAVIHCGAKEHQRKQRANYVGVLSCLAVNMVGGGDLTCRYGCLGRGDCVNACPFGAIELKGGLPEIELSKCTGCGKCVEACPRRIISLEVFDTERGVVAVACSSHEKGAKVKEACEVGCIGCGICEKVTEGAFKVEDNLARVNFSKLTKEVDLDKAVEKCPTKCIVKIKEASIYT